MVHKQGSKSKSAPLHSAQLRGKIRSIKSFQKNNRMAGNQVSLQWVDMLYIYLLDAQKD
jgi:hypothetical protein